MSSDYLFLLQRLKEERVRRNLTQRMLCYCMKMQESHYSKAEAGHRRFSYQEMKGLCNSDVDVLYVFTGKRAKNEPGFRDPLGTGFEEAICCLNIIYILAGFVYSIRRNKGSFEYIQKQLRYLQCGNASSGAKSNVFCYVRNRCGYTQQKMADLLGIDIKKLRALEKGKLLPDSEIIWKMCDLFQISPAFILKDSKGLWSELSYVLDLLENEDRDTVLQILEKVYKLIN